MTVVTGFDLRERRAVRYPATVTVRSIENPTVNGAPINLVRAEVQRPDSPKHQVQAMFDMNGTLWAGVCDCPDFFKTAEWAEIAQPINEQGARVCRHLQSLEHHFQSLLQGQV